MNDTTTDLATVSANAALKSQNGVMHFSDHTKRHLEHAESIRVLNAELRTMRRPIKATYADIGLDYGLARHAVYVAGIVQMFERTEPRVRELGPSLLLLLHEASRRFAREGRTGEVTDLLSDMLSGMPRSALRSKYLPPRKKNTASQPATIANAFERLLASGM